MIELSNIHRPNKLSGKIMRWCCIGN